MLMSDFFKDRVSTYAPDWTLGDNTFFTYYHFMAYKAFLHIIYSEFSGMGKKRFYLNVLRFDRFLESSLKTKSNDILGKNFFQQMCSMN